MVVSHRADYRQPSPPVHKKMSSISERISEHLHEASEKVAKREENARNRKIIGSEGDLFGYSRQCALDGTGSSSLENAARKLRSVRSYDGDLGHYHDRTLPATLMMTLESKQQKFAFEDNALKRSSSATLRSSSNRKSSRNKSHRPDSGRMRIYNDFGSNFGQYRNKRNVRRTSNLSSRISSKPSNTSDYVSDVETVLTDRTIAVSGRSSSLPWANINSSNFAECDSVLQDHDDHFDLEEQKLRQALRDKIPSLALQPTDLIHHDEVIGNRKNRDRFLDDRTESQQNTMRSETFYNYNQDIPEERCTVEGQSSDTESMADSSYTATEGSSFSFKRRQYNSDNELLNRNMSSRRGKTRRKRQVHRSRSDGWDSEPNESTRRRRPRSKNTPRPHSKLMGMENLAFDGTQTFSKVRLSSKDGLDGEIQRLQKGRRSNRSKNSPSSYHSASLKSPIAGTLMEMPIYSQATWAGPESAKYKKNLHKKTEHTKRNSSNSSSSSRKVRKIRKQVKAGRKLSIGGGGRYFCEYGSLPVDLSKLPKDLVAKIGGQTDQLLEPIEHLNFDELCKPLPSLGKEGQPSARRLVADKLPPNHRDREVLSNTYELEDTGLVLTDL